MTCELVALVNVTKAFWISQSPSSPTLQIKSIGNRLAHPPHAWRLADRVWEASREFFKKISLKIDMFSALCRHSWKWRNNKRSRSSEQMKPLSTFLCVWLFIFIFLHSVVLCGLLGKLYGASSLNGDGSSGTYKAYNQNWQPHLNKYFPPGPCLSLWNAHTLCALSPDWLDRSFGKMVGIKNYEERRDYKFPIDNMFFCRRQWLRDDILNTRLRQSFNGRWNK